MALQYQSSLTGPEIDAALEDMAAHNSEAWAVGARDGVEVGSTDITYHNNAEYYAENANAAAARAEAAVPSGTAGAVFFDRAQTLTEAQQTRARTNIGAQENIADTLQFEDSLAIGTRKFTTANMQTGGAGWYRVADIDLTRSGSLGSVFHCSGLILIGGFYSGYKPSKGAFSFTYDGGTAFGNIVQLGGVAGNSPTQIRISNTNANHTKGTGHLLIDLYYSDTRLISQTVSVIVGGARRITMQDPELITGTPTGEFVRATLDIQTIKTGAINSVLTARHHVTGISSLAALKTQLSTWYAEQGTGSLGYYTMATSGNLSPITPVSASLGIEIRAGATANYGTAVLTSHSSTGAAMFIMALNNGTWTDPVKIS